MAHLLPPPTGHTSEPACLFKNIFPRALRARQARQRAPGDMHEDDAGHDPDLPLGATIYAVKTSKRNSRQARNLLCQTTWSGSKPVKAGDKVSPEQDQKDRERIGSRRGVTHQVDRFSQAMRVAPEAKLLLQSVPLPESIPADNSLCRRAAASKHQDSRSLAKLGCWGAPIAVSIRAAKVEAGAADRKLRWMAEELALVSVINWLSTELVEANIASYLVRTGSASMRKLAEEIPGQVNFTNQQQVRGGMGQGPSGVTITTIGGETREQDQTKTDIAHKIHMTTDANHEVLIPTACAAMIGFASGATTSAKLSGYQFMVENLHRLPQTRQDWYFFQKTKNYKMILGGLRGGLKVGAKLGAWTAAFCSLKEGLCLSPLLEDRKSVAGGLSGFGIALGAGIFYRLRPVMSPRRLLLGGLLGLCAGAAEEAKNMLVKDPPSP